MKKKAITLTVEREPDPPGPEFTVHCSPAAAHAVVRGRDSEQLARLIEAAPKLLAACETLIMTWEQHHDECRFLDTDEPADCDCGLRRAVEAIEDATGRVL